MRSTKQEPASTKPAHIPVSGQGLRPPAQIEALGQKDTKTSGQPPVLPGVRPSKHIHMGNEPLNLQQLAPQMSGRIYTGNQEIMKAADVMGSVGKTDKRHIYTGDQTVTHNGFGVMGDVSTKAAEYYLRELKNDRDHGLDPDDESDEREDETRQRAQPRRHPKGTSDPYGCERMMRLIRYTTD